MRKSPKDFPLHSSKSDHRPSSKKITLVTYLSKQLLPVNCDVAIVQERGRVRLWILDSSGRLSMRLVDTDLEVLACTFLVNRSYMKGSLTLRATSKKGIHATLCSSPRTGLKSMSASMTLYPAGLIRPTGVGDERQDLQGPPY